VAAVVYANVRPASVGSELDLEPSVAGSRVHNDVCAALLRHVAAQRDGIDGNYRIGAGQFGQLDDKESNGAHAENRDRVTKADVAVADGAKREVGRVEADCRLPGDPVREFARVVGAPDVLLPK